jgi:hypothetical protein
MNYEKIYQDLCKRGKNRKKVRGSNLEKHHIIPTFFYKNNKRNHRYNDGIYEGSGEHIGNITLLTPREHFIAHLILCKIWKNTKWEYRCYLSLKMFLNGGKLNNVRSVFECSSRKYEYHKIKSNKAISKGKAGTMPAKEASTGNRLGIVKTDHPKVLSGEWVHITKGIQKSEEKRLLYSKKGLENSNSRYSDKDIFESYKKCCYHYGKLVNGTIWILFSQTNNLPYLKFFKQFRFGNRGWKGMQEDLLQEAKKDKKQIEIIANYKSKEWRQFVKEEKRKWVSK